MTKRNHRRTDLITTRRRHRTYAVIPEPYRQLYAVAGHHREIYEFLEIVTGARTVASYQDQPDGWIFLDQIIELYACVFQLLELERDDPD